MTPAPRAASPQADAPTSISARMLSCAGVPPWSAVPAEACATNFEDEIDNYPIEGVIAEGTYGVVRRAKHKETGEAVVIKQSKLQQVDEGMHGVLVRELLLLRHLTRFNHPNICGLLSCAWRNGMDEVFLVLKYHDYNLGQVVAAGIPQWAVLPLARQLLQGVAFLHSQGIMHRDLKPQNTLVDKQGALRLCDFGLARLYMPSNEHSREVATLWYRAPEIILGLVTYTPAIDIWSAGCIIAEMYNGGPLFPGECEVDTFIRICHHFGAPQRQGPWAALTKCPDWQPGFPAIKGCYIEDWVNIDQAGGGDLARELVSFLLMPDWTQRIPAKWALQHKCFASVSGMHFVPQEHCANPAHLEHRHGRHPARRTV
eukprot:TRINITY_DN48451_c0_g1_i1.p1 TRINITY_DN48451_c0_g1~~TRINITY_DN48451_c0_g1_i1.p1  ORF type:complete len:397 (+),score=109.66 TRINITY_DN48451_c0_g1_i1:81-1193(+)